MEVSALSRHFAERFGTEPQIFSAPGRVNLIGEHTDYSDGFVMPCAIGFYTHVAIAPRSDRRLVLASEKFPRQLEFDLDALPTRTGEWCDYVLGVAGLLQKSMGAIPGATMLVGSDIPIGAGLSSSAALEVASALALLCLQKRTLSMPEIAKLCQQAENEFVGARVGIMDQFVSCMGRKGRALLLDCRSLTFTLIPVPVKVQLVICNTMVKHELASNQYNLRRAECEQGVRVLSQWYPEIRELRDVTVDQLVPHVDNLPTSIYSRCLHVVSENQRVLDAAEALTNGQLSEFGELMLESHHSLRDLYEVSCPELDIMVDSAEGLPGYYGGRMTGGGFGGCTVNLVNAGDTPAFASQIAVRYERATGTKPDVYIASPADGAEVLEPAQERWPR